MAKTKAPKKNAVPVKDADAVKLGEALQVVLADSFLLYLKTQNYHWNVTGPNFVSAHDLFEAQYTDLREAIDEIAERIRALGIYAPGAFSIYQKISSIKENTKHISWEEMIKDLANDQNVVVKSAQKVLEMAEKIGDEVTIDMMVHRQTVHQKNAWMLNAQVQK